MPRTLATARYSIGGYQAKVLGYNPTAYWPLNETSGTVADNAQGNAAMDGSYVGVRLGRTSFVNGEPAGFFDGAAYVNIYSATLAGLFNPLLGALMVWSRFTANTWLDSTVRYMARLGVGGNDFAQIRRTSTNNELRAQYGAGGVTTTVSFATSGPTEWFHTVITWDKVADQVKFYYAGAQQGGTQTGLGVWVGSLHSANCAVGAQNTSLSSPIIGQAAHVALYPTALSAAAIADLAIVN